jgi:hypothetical protein
MAGIGGKGNTDVDIVAILGSIGLLREKLSQIESRMTRLPEIVMSKV